MFQQLDEVERRFEELTSMMSDPSLASDPSRFAEAAKERARLEETVVTYQEFKQARAERGEVHELLSDASDDEMKAMAREELASLDERLDSLRASLQLLLVPRDPMDDKNVLLEIRAGTGGDEASLFAGDLFRMYSRYAEGRRWRVEVLSASEGVQGGYKEIIALIAGDQVYSQLKFEAGVHRVQRVPATESQGRIHTSACTVAVLPEADDVDVKINESDLRVDVYRSSGAGGQHVNTTDSAVRITHLPTNIVVTCQDERSQHKNKAKAMKVLQAKLLEQEQRRQDSERSAERRSMVGSGDRSERIRTYNFPQNRVTDHRIDLTLHRLDSIVQGESLGDIIDALTAHAAAEALAHSGMGG